MKKFLIWLIGIIFALLVLIVVVLFTPPGNALVKSIIQSQIDKYAPIKLDVNTFSLGFSRIDVAIAHSDKIFITLNGDFSLFSQTLDLALKVDAKDISVLGELADTPLQGSFIINTTAKGAINNIEINTTSDIAKSFTDIRVLLQEYSPTSIIAHIKDAQIKEILAMAGVKPYANGLLNLEADIKGDKDMNFNGNALLSIAQGLVDSTLIKNDFGVDVPKTTFVTTLNALFDMDKLNHDLSFNANIGNIHSSGQTLIKDLSTKTTYDVKLSDLSAFTPLVGMPIRGAFETQGEINGNMESLHIKGSSNIASSHTTYEATLQDFSPKSAQANIKNLRLDTLLWMIYMPRYATMNLDLDTEVSDFDAGISTESKLTLTGTTTNAVMKKELDLDMPNTNFTIHSDISLNKGVGVANSTLNADIAQTSTQANINLNDMLFNANYEVKIPNLKKLKFLTGIELAGDFVANGVAKLDEALYADFHTQSLGGAIDAILNNNKLNATLKDVNTLKLFQLTQLPEVFSSDMNGALEYDTLTEKGELKAIISNGKLMPNQITELASKYLKTDITKEAYEDAALNATIDKQIIKADIALKSNNTTISAQGASIDTDKGTINADMKFQIKDQYIYLKARNQLSSPNISIDAGDLIKAEAGKAISKGAQQAIDKYIKDDSVKENAQKLLNNLFK
ncbi:translocation/assembly module TamB domain-containing protein [Helicobacter marmotae]|uniref:Outer membrane protein n=1 Tax=Helicobacter marmotae TaxID=152490 RepID=A0A3D8I3E8_9HELI|nr:hypothetical protein [Helicobacter marmotae]RDU59615.1 hypothetical protein CQA63_05915 [Helicobacter marmotae]